MIRTGALNGYSFLMPRLIQHESKPFRSDRVLPVDAADEHEHMVGSWIDDVLRWAAGLGDASDLAVEPDGAGGIAVRVRQAGCYRSLAAVDGEAARTVIGRLKALAGVPAYIVDEAQDGRIDGRPFGWQGDLRAAFLPTARGVRAALRLPAIGALPTAEALDLPEAVLANLRGLLAGVEGLLLVCGPTGSGKSTTIHALLSDLVRRRDDRLPLAIEDPVERLLDGVIQVDVAPHRGLGFAEALRAGLRHDPDVLVIGEIRDPDTAQAAVRAALSGHVVISTLHCARAVEALPRMLEMGVAQELLLPALRGVLAQRLLRRVHAPCAGQGCPDCHGGYLGRTVVVDWLRPDHTQRLAWARGEAPTLIADMDQQAAALVATRHTDARECERVLGAGLC